MLATESEVDDRVELKIRTCNEVVARKLLDLYEQIDIIYVISSIQNVEYLGIVQLEP